MGRPRILTTGTVLGLAFRLGTASASPVRSPEPAVYSKGLRARIEGETASGEARVHGHARNRRIARKRFGDVRLRGGPTPAEWRARTLVATRQAVLACDAPGSAALLSSWPLFPGGLPWRDTCGGAVTLARESWQPASTGPALRRSARMRTAYTAPRLEAAVRDTRRIRTPVRKESRRPSARPPLSTEAQAPSGKGQPGARLRARCAGRRTLEPVQAAGQRRSSEFPGVMVRAPPSGNAAAFSFYMGSQLFEVRELRGNDVDGPSWQGGQVGDAGAGAPAGRWVNGPGSGSGDLLGKSGRRDRGFSRGAG